MMREWWMGAFVVMLAATLGFYLRVIFGRYMLKSSEHESRQLMNNAQRDSEETRKEAKIQAKAEVIKAREEFENESKTRRKEGVVLDERFAQRELNLDRKVTMIDKKDQALEQKIADISKKETEMVKQKDELGAALKAQNEKLQQIAGMRMEEARTALLARTEAEVRTESGLLIRRLQEEAKETAEQEAGKIVALAIQRYAFGHVSELMTSTVQLPSEDMKGRIIGREGRNIRALEAATGVDLLVDDTPETVVISSFDPLRREVARRTLERLIADGRIHPGRVEEVVAKVREEIDEIVRTTGEEAIFAMGLQTVPPELVGMLGRLKYRSSYTQNVLMHSTEVAQLMGTMASELGLDIALAKRVGLFHDIGKALDSQVEGKHAIIGADLLRRQGEQQILINAVAAHHMDVEAESIYAVLASAADAISAARVGARSETAEIYIKRLQKLEAITNSFPGVEKSYAIQAGREARIIVQPDKVDDNGLMELARNVAKKIEQELQYPGQIKVVVIRERRCVEYAH